MALIAAHGVFAGLGQDAAEVATHSGRESRVYMVRGVDAGGGGAQGRVELRGRAPRGWVVGFGHGERVGPGRLDRRQASAVTKWAWNARGPVRHAAQVEYMLYARGTDATCNAKRRRLCDLAAADDGAPQV